MKGSDIPFVYYTSNLKQKIMKKSIERMPAHGCAGLSRSHFIITVGKKKYFQSFQSLIAINDDGKITLDRYWWYYCTKTTCAYRNKFLGEDRKTTEKKIESGEYKLANLDDKILTRLNSPAFVV